MALLFIGPKEPTYEGVTLTKWLYSTIAITRWQNEDGPVDDPREVAILAIGTNALPKLLSMIGSSDGMLKQKLIDLVNGQKIIRARIHPAEEKHVRAFLAFTTLGTNALPAVPEFIKLTKHADPKVRFWALRCLTVVGPEKSVLLPVLSDELEDADRHVRELTTSYVDEKIHPTDTENLSIYKKLQQSKQTAAASANK